MRSVDKCPKHFLFLPLTTTAHSTLSAYMFHTECAIDCTSWLDDSNDTELDVIADFLEGIVNVSDIRDYVEFWREGAGIVDSM